MTTRATIVVTEFMADAAVADLAGSFPVQYDAGLADRRSDLLSAVGEARGLIVRNRTTVDEELLGAAPRLEVVGRLGVGLDNIDLEACRARNVDVRPALGANAVAVAEYVVAAMLLLTRGGFEARDRVVAGDWPRSEMVGREIAGKRLGLVGMGDIAREVAERAAALGMDVSATDPFIGADDAVWRRVARCSLGDLVAGSDIISIHVPLTPETRHLFDAARLDQMKESSILINTSRGGTVDEDALVTALRSATLRGAALDVFEQEPVDARGGSRFADVPNLILTPHIAGVTEEANVRVSAVTAANVLAVLNRTG
ncbi:MAG: NAD(P)-dependent oxidoreductase [Acidimicrobiia bacterium]